MDLGVADRYTGNITAYLRADGSVRLDVTPGPLRISGKLAAMAAEGEHHAMDLEDGIVTFRGHADDGTPQVFRYRTVGQEADGPEDGLLLCEPAL